MEVCHVCKDLRREIEGLRNELEAERKRADEAEEVIFRIQTHMVENNADLNVLVPNSDPPVFFFSAYGENDELGGFDFWQVAEKLAPVGDITIGEVKDV